MTAVITELPSPCIWELDEFAYYNLKFLAEVDWYTGRRVSPIHAWISRRPSYCDRGHWQAGIDGIPSIDSSDGFPRYYMSLEIAKREMEAWLRWRLFKQDTPP